ncbi:Glycoprotein-N-acetylgalactosamine 3-beta-galactosyltransferase 1 [Holothuria leucospilota]|uniref:N-acetylgalactosaminide beta-1,3-galactosyltransferase n=1 Tax=Holothuria leucospilota TaxID=206669 RepID=A0A9Q1BGW5_HOLLE|nr:Glycoprotein-N-acetylgalactosamine 3-beta-galactosyltransferase 1 [Holothuria leucospilota]
MNSAKQEDFYPEDELKSKSQKISTDYSFTSVSVLCWVMTSPGNLFTKAIHITQTWGTKCNLTLYVTSEEPDRPFPGKVLTLPVKEGRNALWNKTKAAFSYIHTLYRDRYDWFLKADDDSFIIVDNLRYFLASKNTFEPVLYGALFHLPTELYDIDYMSGGAGYVMGRETLNRFMDVAFDEKKCPSDEKLASFAEDVYIGYCLSKVAVRLESTLDSLDRIRFLPIEADLIVRGTVDTWVPKYLKQNFSTGVACCSDYLISTHRIKPDWMYFMHFVSHHLRLASQSKHHNYLIDGKVIPI